MASMNYFLILSRDYLLRVFYILMNKYLYNILLTNVTEYVGNWAVNTDKWYLYRPLYGKTGLIRLRTGLYTGVGMRT
jgi:hypothetical protein